MVPQGSNYFRCADDSETRTLAASLQTWFREWVEEGFFTRIELG